MLVDSCRRPLAGVVDDDVAKVQVAPISLREFAHKSVISHLYDDGAFVRLMDVALFLKQKRERLELGLFRTPCMGS